jgi:hypothetical protein
MGTILSYIDKNNPGEYHCYSTRKISLDDNINDQLTHEGYDRDAVSSDTKGQKYAESDTTNVKSVLVPLELIKSPNTNIYKYYLDGSRHTFKVDDIAIGKHIYPIIAGQIIVGCCHRKDRDTFEKVKVKSEIIISLPKNFCEGRSKPKDYLRKYAEDLTAHLQQNNRFAKDHNIVISKIVLYPIDGVTVGDETDKNRFINSGIAQIQNAMTDEEQLTVEQLCNERKLSDISFLIKDGSIQYNPNYSLMAKDDPAKWNNMRKHYQHVIGISKSFDPTLLKNKNQDIARTIAELEPFHRTKAYLYKSEQSNEQTFAVWYVRIRNSNFRQTNFSDIVKCELLMLNPQNPISSDTIDWLSANIIREAYPVCYGNDTRWANHLYPVYLTETFCKTQYIDKNIFLGLF